MLVVRDLHFQNLLMAARNYLGEIAYVGPKIHDIPAELKPFLDFSFQDSKNLQTVIEIDQIEVLKPGKKKAIFLDRDGVINVDHGYVGQIAQVELLPGIAQFIHKANRLHCDVNVVTNQSGIGRGLYFTQDYENVMTYIQQLLRQDQAHLNYIEYAPFHPESKNPLFHQGREFRKPRPGMILRLQQAHGYNLSESILIGDKASDLMSAIVAGVGHIYLFESEQSGEEWSIFKNWLQVLRTYGFTTEFDHIKMRQISQFSEVHI